MTRNELVIQDSINDETIACVRTLLAEDYWFTISGIHREMAECYLMHTSRTTIFGILPEEVKIKVSTRWVPRMLTQDNGKNHTRVGLEMLTGYNEEGEFFKSDCNCDETWLHYWMPECKSTSIVRKMANKHHLKSLKKNHLQVKF